MPLTVSSVSLKPVSDSALSINLCVSRSLACRTLLVCIRCAAVLVVSCCAFSACRFSRKMGVYWASRASRGFRPCPEPRFESFF